MNGGKQYNSPKIVFIGEIHTSDKLSNNRNVFNCQQYMTSVVGVNIT